MNAIKSIHAREILASGADPSLEVTVMLEDGSIGEASVPYGASAGIHEATVLLDGDDNRYNGKGMLKAIANIQEQITPVLIGFNGYDLRGVDQKMIDLDGTENKSNLGGNAILGVSLAVAHASANSRGVPLYQHIRDTFDLNINEYILPNPMMVVIEGGKHADDSTDLQEFIFSVSVDSSARDAVRTGIEAYHSLKNLLKEKNLNTTVGNEGAFAPPGLNSNEEPFSYMLEAIRRAGFEAGKDIGLSFDAAASEYWDANKGKYVLSLEDKEYTASEISEYYKAWFEKYPLYTVEDMLHEDDWENWVELNKITNEYHLLHIGDDLTVTNKKRLQKAIDMNAISAILIKLNQIGSLTETVDTCMLARQHGLVTVVSHRGGGETNDTSMIDLAVALNSGFVKVGPSRGERVSKYNRLMRIEEELESTCRIAGSSFREVT